MAHTFFLSYARSDADAYFKRFGGTLPRPCASGWPAREEVARTLRQTFDVQDIERRTEPTQGDVRSFHAADADVAENVAIMVEKALAGTGYPLRLRRLRPDSTRYRNVPRGQIEVWLPSLSRPVFRK